jgi:hypothetical protein
LIRQLFPPTTIHPAPTPLVISHLSIGAVDKLCDAPLKAEFEFESNVAPISRVGRPRVLKAASGGLFTYKVLFSARPRAVRLLDLFPLAEM